MDVKRKVVSLIKRFGTDNPEHIARELGIVIQYAPLDGKKYAYYMKYKCVKTIIIDNLVTPPHLLLFVMAHELGHAICTPDDNTAWLSAYTIGNEDKTECIANRFAVELLLNDAYLKDYPECSIYHLAALRGVPERNLYLKQ